MWLRAVSVWAVGYQECGLECNPEGNGMRKRLVVIAAVALAPVWAQGGRGGGGGQQAAGPAQTIEARTAGMQKIDGFFPMYWEERTGSLFLEIPKFHYDFLLTAGLAAGLGSN